MLFNRISFDISFIRRGLHGPLGDLFYLDFLYRYILIFFFGLIPFFSRIYFIFLSRRNFFRFVSFYRYFSFRTYLHLGISKYFGRPFRCHRLFPLDITVVIHRKIYLISFNTTRVVFRLVIHYWL